MADRTQLATAAPECPCRGTVALTYGSEVHPTRVDLASKPFWVCADCKRRVGCHPGTIKPLGELADDETRKARNRAHRAFDPIWRDGHLPRMKAYAWLAANLGLPVKACHIANFDAQTRDLVESLCCEFMRQLRREERP